MPTNGPRPDRVDDLLDTLLEDATLEERLAAADALWDLLTEEPDGEAGAQRPLSEERAEEVFAERLMMALARRSHRAGLT